MTNVKLQVNCLLAVVRKCTFAVTFVWQIDRKPNGYSIPRDKLLISREIDSGVDHLTFVGLVECF